MKTGFIAIMLIVMTATLFYVMVVQMIDIDLYCEDKLATRGFETCNVLTLFGILNSETNMMNCIRRLIFYCIR